jgi:hypothetical protein
MPDRMIDEDDFLCPMLPADFQDIDAGIQALDSTEERSRHLANDETRRESGGRSIALSRTRAKKPLI